MEEIDYGKLIRIVESSIKPSYQAYQIDSKPEPNVANLGALSGQVAKLDRHGEYYGIGIEFLTDVKPLLTNLFVIRLLQMLKKEDYITPMAILNLTTQAQLQYILHYWFAIATTSYNNELFTNKTFDIFNRWIRTVTHDPILTPIKVVDIGFNENTSQSVLPIEWIDRRFESGIQMQEEMSKLETRIGRPPVTYAIIYAMNIQKNDTYFTSIANTKAKNIIYLDLINNELKSTLVKVKNSRPSYEYVQYDSVLIGFKLKDILEPKTSTSNIKEVGLLVSRLQKAIRRGRYGSNALDETIEALNVSPNYNLPEHQFLRVSASKQMAWRLFIAILEDCRPFKPTTELGLSELLLLVLITQKILEYKFTPQVLYLIKQTALLAQYNDLPSDLVDLDSIIPAETTTLTNNPFKNCLHLAINNIIMMSGDNMMLRQYYSMEKSFGPFIHPKKFLHNQLVYDDIVLSSYDMHNKTNIILYYQACSPIGLTTKQISSYIWDISSSWNIRSGKPRPPIDPLLLSIQQYYLLEPPIPSPVIFTEPPIINIKPGNHAKRSSFLIAFGTKYKHQSTEIVIAGTSDTPARVKKNNEWTYSANPTFLNAYPSRQVILHSIDPPLGFKWTKPKVLTSIKNSIPMIDSKPIDFFDGSDLITSITPLVTKTTNNLLLSDLFSGSSIEFSTLIKLRTTSSTELYNWNISSESINLDLLQLTYTKIFNQFNNIIMIGPVSRTGNKMQNSISYLLEGKLWAIFCLLSHMYPQTFRPSGSLNFHIKKETSGYVHLIQSLESILFSNNKITGPIPSIKTKLWDHQKESVSRIIGGFKTGRFGFGDASSVGSGKTLTAISIAAELIKTNNVGFSGILVLLPGNKLIQTWEDELEKHTEGFDIIFQGNNSKVGPIKRNTILVSTMGRMRDHPINHRWLLMIIDECLTVQNKNALWTESAWKQSMSSKHLVMMSATFFRTRFDKLYYMLKMLRTGLPEKKEYLDAILLESIISQVSLVNRVWVSNFNYFKLGDELLSEYEQLDRVNLNTEARFAKLTSFLVSNSQVNDIVQKQLQQLIKLMEKDNHRCLIYAREKSEAEYWSKKLAIGIYPKKGIHCIVTYHDGTYGLNDLVIYDTIIMRPPRPDYLPQIKGRLDRPGQQSNKLHVEYFVLDKTIEVGLILRMNISSQFVQKYIMPLSKFYDVSVNFKKYLDENT